MGNLAATSHGACMSDPGPLVRPEGHAEAVQERCTSLYGVPTMFIAELNLPDFASYDFTSLRTGIMAGSPCPVEVMKRVVAEMHMEQVSICYGMTETSPVSLQTRMDDEKKKKRERERETPPPPLSLSLSPPSNTAPAPSAGSCPTSRSRSSTRSPA